MCGSKPSIRVVSRVDGAEPGHPPTAGPRSIDMPYVHNKLAATATAVLGTGLDV